MHTRIATLRNLAAAAALTCIIASCGGALPTSVPSISLPTLPPDGMASGTGACVDAPTMAIIDQLQATGADLPALLAANKDALIAGLSDLESSDPNTTAWRDALVDALESGDVDAAADEIARLANDEVTITPC
jgi:hypothetical protein